VRFFNDQGLVEKLRCALSLPNLFPSLARCFACCQSCSVSLRTLWAYGFDSAAQCAPENLRLVRKKNILFPSTNSTWLVKLTLRYFLIPLIERQKPLIHPCLPAGRQTGMFLKINFQILGMFK